MLRLRLPDIGFVSVFFGIACACWRLDTVLWQCTGVVLAALAIAIAYISSGPGVWLRSTHLGGNGDYSVSSIKHARKIGARMPTPYPDAWYAVGLTEMLPPGCVLPVTVCNINLVVWRPMYEEGSTDWPSPIVMDAYCTHLGAHLGLGGGRVEGDCIRCPFHGWQFDQSGKLKSIPEVDTCPTNADMKVWPSMEKNSVISVWVSSHLHRRSPPSAEEISRLHAKLQQGNLSLDAPAKSSLEIRYEEPVSRAEDPHVSSDCQGVQAAQAMYSELLPERRALNKPWYDIPAFASLNGASKWIYHGYTENIVNAVLFEIPENGSDVAHLPALHREFVIPSLTSIISHKWEATWSGTPNGARSHIADITVKEAIALFEVTMPGEVNVKITQCGPSQVFLEMQTPMGPMVVVETVTPVAPMQLRVIHAVYSASYVPAFFAKVVMLMTLIQFEKDVPIWCNKRYESRPNLSKADRSIPVYRRWITQFNTPDSVTFEEATKSHLRDQLGLPVDAKLDW